MSHSPKITTTAEALAYVRERDLPYVRVGLFDIDGVFRGKYINRDKFESALEKGLGFCDVVLGWDSNDQLYDNVKVTGWHTGYPDAEVRMVPDTMRIIPFEDDLPLFLCEFAGKWEDVCPRGVLRRVLAKAADMGFSVSAAAEFEFFLFEETPHSVREKNYRNLNNITPGFFGYSMLRSSVHADFYRLEDPEEVAELGLDDYRADAVLIAEWPEHAGGFAHEPGCLSMRFEIGENERVAIVEAGPDWLERRGWT